MSASLLSLLRSALAGALLTASVCTPVLTAEAPGPTVREVVEFTRIVRPENGDAGALSRQVSPDGQRAFIVTRQADVGSNVNRYRILLLDVAAARLASGQAAAPVSLWNAEARQDESYADPSIQGVRWADERTLVFLAREADRPFQVYRLDVVTHERVQLTDESRRIVSFAVSRDLRRVLYAAQLPNPPMPPGAYGLAVGNRSFWSVKFGQDNLRSQARVYRYFVAESGSNGPARPLGEAFPESNGVRPQVSLSPDGRWALVPRYEAGRQLAWARQYPQIAEQTQLVGPSLIVDPASYFSRPTNYVPRRMVAYRVADGREQAVVDAPDDTSASGSAQHRSDRLWQRDGRSVVLAGTHLPALPGQDAPPGSYVVEYWPDSNRWEVIAALKSRLQQAYALGGGRDGFSVIDGEVRRVFLREANGRWLEKAGVEDAATAGRDRWTLSVAQGLNEPPDVVATDATGSQQRLTQLNPQFGASRWGTMRPYAWRDAEGRQWEGGLMGASGLDRRSGRLPLVIQTYGFSPDRFYLDGPNVADGYSSGFAGRAFLREGLLVLAMPWRPAGAPPRGERDAVQVFMDGVRGAVETLASEGVIDPARVGIIGWSATGERVLNLVTFSDLPLQAATLADGDANTLFSVAVTYGGGDNLWARKERINDGLPFGPSLDRWIRSDPSLHTDCVRTALRIETYGPAVLNNWDIYALLRRQYKPAEMIVIPGGSHSLSRPGERMLSLQGNVDWHRFWLTGEEREQPLLDGETRESLQKQYAEWRQMREMKRVDDARPRCARQQSAK